MLYMASKVPYAALMDTQNLFTIYLRFLENSAKMDYRKTIFYQTMLTQKTVPLCRVRDSNKRTNFRFRLDRLKGTTFFCVD